MGNQKTPLQKTYEINVGQDSEVDYFDVTSNERLYLDLKASSGYVQEVEKIEKNNSLNT